MGGELMATQTASVAGVEAGESQSESEGDSSVKVSVTATEAAETDAEMNAETNGPLEANTSVNPVQQSANWVVVVIGVLLFVGAIVAWRGR